MTLTNGNAEVIHAESMEEFDGSTLRVYAVDGTTFIFPWHSIAVIATDGGN